MGDNRGQTIFLSVIGIATLLVTIIGATFAYFTTTVTPEGSGGSTQSTTATVGNTTVKFEDESASHYTKLEYPGGLAVTGAKASIEKSNVEDAGNDDNEYQATFGLTITYQNPTSTQLDWELYKISDSSPLTKEDFSDMDCDLRTLEDGASTYLWYAGSSSSTKTDSCSLVSAVTSKLSTSIASGKLDANQDELLPYEDSLSQLSNLTLNTNDNPDDYYYLVVKYPNDTAQTKDDQGKVINVVLGIDSTNIKVDIVPAQ